jgi:hypothetical protein
VTEITEHIAIRSVFGTGDLRGQVPCVVLVGIALEKAWKGISVRTARNGR